VKIIVKINYLSDITASQILTGAFPVCWIIVIYFVERQQEWTISVDIILANNSGAIIYF
jgi:hypothetical protein